MSNVALVLSGGGAKAAAHVGVARALGESGIAVSHYAGTSMGAVVAAALAAGTQPDALLARMKKLGSHGMVRRRGLAIRGLTAPSLLRSEPLIDLITQLVPVRTFRELAVPLSFTAVDVDTGALVVFGDGGEEPPLIDALAGSCALALYFEPIWVEGRRLVDGGLRGVLPLELALRDGVTEVIASDIGAGIGERDPGTGPSLLRAHNASTGILMADNTQLRLALWRADPARPPLLYIRPEIAAGSTFRGDQVEQFAAEGYRAARAALSAERPV